MKIDRYIDLLPANLYLKLNVLRLLNTSYTSWNPVNLLFR